jgi:TonB family protein
LGYAQRSAWENSSMLALLAPQPLRELLLREAAPLQLAPPAVNDMTSGRNLRLPRLPLFAEAAPAPLPAQAPTAEGASLQLPAMQLRPEPIAPVLPDLAVPAPAPLAAEAIAPAPLPAAAQPADVSTKVALREPIAAHAVQPAYPERALLRGIEGSVRLSYSVDADGHVTDVRVEKSAMDNLLDSAAVAALRKWRFVPGSFEADSRRYSRLFAFALQAGGSKAGFAEEGVDPNECRIVTGTRICRRPGDAAQVDLEATAALD